MTLAAALHLTRKRSTTQREGGSDEYRDVGSKKLSDLDGAMDRRAARSAARPGWEM